MALEGVPPHVLGHKKHHCAVRTAHTGQNINKNKSYSTVSALCQFAKRLPLQCWIPDNSSMWSAVALSQKCEDMYSTIFRNVEVQTASALKQKILKPDAEAWLDDYSGMSFYSAA